ncbi:hypothetical protein MC7420_4709 [Coleofasciculus chthonoplastes PCC 7420]|uniref:Uncharacterized protein n=1 Tax=Coleofasciculus chthonoplastes PCC 7420 TaxID=118168 RepID=B4VNY9_9CYAN|nr:hypothetical protein MC7420_4709 [Coleofasciculus chthonoplastes PCC 7420]
MPSFSSPYRLGGQGQLPISQEFMYFTQVRIAISLQKI